MKALVLPHKWKLKVKGKKLKQLTIPNIGNSADYPNLDDDPAFVFQKERTSKLSLHVYPYSIQYHDPIQAFDNFYGSLKAGKRPTSKRLVIDIGLNLYDSHVLSDTGKRNRIKILLDYFADKRFSHNSSSIQLLGFVNRRNFKSIDATHEYLQMAGAHGKITSNIIGNAIMGLCENNNPSVAFQIWKDNFQSISTANIMERYRWLHIIFHAFSKDLSSNLSHKILEDPQVKPFSQLYAHTLLNYLFQANDANSNSDKLLSFFKLYLKNGQNNLSLNIWCDILKICDLHNLSSLKLECIKILLSKKIDVDFLNSIIDLKILLKENRFKQAKKVADELDKYPGSHLVLNEIITLLCESSANACSKIEKGELLGLINLFYVRLRDSKKHINNKTYLSILQEFSKVGNSKRCRSIILNMKRRGLILTQTHYFYLIDSYCRSGSVILAHEVLQEMKKVHLKPNSRIFSTIIATYLSQSEPNYSKAFSYLKQMPLLKIKLDPEIYEIFMMHFSKNQEISKANEWIHILQKLGIIPRTEVYNWFMKLCLEKKPDMVPLIFSSCTKPNEESYLLLFKSFCALSEISRVLSLWENTNAFHSNSEAVYSMLQLIRKTKQFSLLESLEKIFEEQTVLNTEFPIHEVYLQCLLAQARFEKIETYLGQIIPKGISISPNLSNMIISKIPTLPKAIKDYLKTPSKQKYDHILATFDPLQLHHFIVKNLNLEKDLGKKFRALAKDAQE